MLKEGLQVEGNKPVGKDKRVHTSLISTPGKILYNSNESIVTADQWLPGDEGRWKRMGKKDYKGAEEKLGDDRYAYSLDCGDGR